MVVAFDWDHLGLADKSYRSRVVRELKAIGFMAKLTKDEYLVNLHYINPFSKQQHEGMVQRLQRWRYIK